MSYTYEALSPGGHQEMLKEVFSKVKERVGSYKTASGSLVSFSDGADLPMPSFVCNIDAVQDLHGYDAPWVGGAGKNKLQNNVTNQTINGITVTVSNDGVITCNGTATAQVAIVIGTFYGEQGVNYKINGMPSGSSMSTYFLNLEPSPTTGGSDTNYYAETEITPVLDLTITARLYIRNGQTVSNLVFKPMIRLSTETDPTFAPYSNICPISGHTGVDAWVRGKNLANLATVTTLYPTGNSGTYPNQIRNSSNARSVIAEVSPNTTYTISKKAGQCFRLAFTAEEPAVGVADMGYKRNDTGTTITVTSPSNAKYMVVLFWSANVDTDTEEDMLATVQIELGETVTTYEPYNPNSQTISVSWQTEAGEVFDGYVDLVSGVLTVTHIITTYDGSDDENWGLNTNYNLFNISIPSDYRVYQTPISNIFKGLEPQSASNLSTKANGSFALYSTFGGINVKTDVAEDVSNFKTYLSQNNMQVVYKLATPITYQLTPQQIKSLLGENNAWCSTGDIKSLQYQPNNIIAELRNEILDLQEWGFSPIIYSTEEREVGVWIDNKPLYQKTLIFSNSYSGDYNDIAININDIDTICHSTGYGISNDTYIPLNFTNKNQNNNACAYYFNSAKTGINFRFGIVLSNITITLQYTKTTDVAGSGSYNTFGIPTVHYTTDEQVIGTWVDGKPLYRKTVLKSGSILQQETISLGIANVENIFLVPDASNVNNGQLPLPLVNGVDSSTNTGGFFDIQQNDTSFLFRIGSDMVSYIENAIITVQYTKTTD